MSQFMQTQYEVLFLVLLHAAVLRMTMRRGSGYMRSQAVMGCLLEKKLQQFELER